MVPRFAAAAVTALLLPGAWGAAYSYDRCAADGPSDWQANFCSANNGEQTPIDICGATTMTSTQQATVAPTCSASWGTAATYTVKNNGHTIQVNVDVNSNTNVTTSFGNLGEYVKHSTYASETTPRSSRAYQLEQLHFHWGRDNTEGSEHYYQGTRYPLEVHFVHFNKACTSSVSNILNGANTCGGAEHLLVVGIQFEVGTTEPAALTTIADAVSGATATAANLGSTIKLSDFWSCGSGAAGADPYYTYPGGLTTPGCNELVTWINIVTPLKVTQATLDKFYAALDTSGEKISKYGNYRPLQSLGARTPLISAGTSAACASVVEPTFACQTFSPNPSPAPSSAVSHSATFGVVAVAAALVALVSNR